MVYIFTYKHSQVRLVFSLFKICSKIRPRLSWCDRMSWSSCDLKPQRIQPVKIRHIVDVVQYGCTHFLYLTALRSSVTSSALNCIFRLNLHAYVGLDSRPGGALSAVSICNMHRTKSDSVPPISDRVTIFMDSCTGTRYGLLWEWYFEVFYYAERREISKYHQFPFCFRAKNAFGQFQSICSRI